jgi:hypothetical protein
MIGVAVIAIVFAVVAGALMQTAWSIDYAIRRSSISGRIRRRLEGAAVAIWIMGAVVLALDLSFLLSSIFRLGGQL